MSARLDVLIKLKDEFTKGMKGVERDFKKSTNNIKKAFREIATLPHLLMAAAPVLAIGNMLKASMAMDALNAKMTAALPAFGASAREMEYISAESDRMGLSFKQTASDYASFAASTTRSGLSLQTTRDIFRDFAEVGTSLKLRPEQMSSVFLALEQMASKGTVQAQELKLQLGQVIPGAFELASKAAGVTGGEFMKMMQKGDVLTNDFLPKFSKMVRSELGGGFEQASQMLVSNLERMKNEWFKFSATVGGLISEDVNGIVLSLSKMMKSINENTEKIKIAYTVVRFPIVVLFNDLQNLYEAFKTIFQFGATAGSMFAAPIISSFTIVSDASKILSKTIRSALIGDWKEVATSGAEGWKKVGDELRLLLKTEENLAKGFGKEFVVNSAKVDKNLTDIADAYAKMQVAFQGGTKKPKMKEVVDQKPIDKTDKTIVEDDWKTTVRLNKQFAALLKKDKAKQIAELKAEYEYRQKLAEQVADAEAMLEQVKIDSKKDGMEKELALVDYKYKEEFAKFAGNEEAMAKVRQAYNIDFQKTKDDQRKIERENALESMNIVLSSITGMTEGVKGFIGLYKAASIIQIIADAHKAASAVWSSMMTYLSPLMGPAAMIPAGAAAGTVYAAGAVRAGQVAGLKFAYGASSFRTSGKTMMMVGDNPGGVEEVNVRPLSSQNVSGPRGGGDTILNINVRDYTGQLIETLRSKVRAGEADRLIRDFSSRGGAFA